MVSTRQMSHVGAGAGAGGCEAEARGARHGAPGSATPPQGAGAEPPAQKHFSTGLLDLPIEVLEKIFRQLGYKTVSQLRLVNRQCNTLCSTILNSTFTVLQNQMLHRFHSIKSMMPRRESARRSHPLACESDIIETLHMRLSLLQMTFGKHIERKHCCFFPGEILDEVYSILSYLKTTVKLARPYKVTDELFDLTTMAMEYFKEHLEPNLPEITYFGTDFFDNITNTFSPGESSKSYICMDSPPAAGFESSAQQPGTSNNCRIATLSYLNEEELSPSPPPPQSNMVLRKRIHRIKQGMKKYNDQLSALCSDLKSCKRKTAAQQKQIAEQQKLLAEQQKQTVDYASRLDDYDKKNEETSRKFQTLLQELNKCKTELQYWRSRSPAVTPVCSECGVAVALGASPEIYPPIQWVVNHEVADSEVPSTSADNSLDLATEALPPPEKKPEDKEKKIEKKPEDKDKKVEKKVEDKDKKTEKKVEDKDKKAEEKLDESSTPPTRRRPSSDANNTPERKKRRLGRPRKL